MAILVTGGAGYIGSHMLWALADAGRAAVVVDDLRSGFRWAVPDGVPFYQADCGDEPVITGIIRRHGIDAVIHFAGSIVVPDSVADPLGYYLNNTVRSRALISACVATGVERFIFSSTAAVYGMAEEMPVAETAPLRPMSPYGSSKLMTEIMLRDASAAHDFRYVALRYFNVAGADPRGRAGQSTPRATHLIKVACETALGLRPHLDIFGSDYPTADGTCVRDYIHVTDLARAHLLALAHLEGGGDSLVLNCGYGRGASVWEVIEAVRRVSRIEFAVRPGPRRPGDPAAIVAKAERIREVLGWQPELDDLELIVRHALAWERALGNGGERRVARSA
jgi:UDP-glucose 4-epimerase